MLKQSRCRAHAAAYLQVDDASQKNLQWVPLSILHQCWKPKIIIYHHNIKKQYKTFQKIISEICSQCCINALCSYPHWKMEIRDSSQIPTTAPIFLQCNYFRQKYLEIASCSDSLLIYIWVRVDHSLLQQ